MRLCAARRLVVARPTRSILTARSFSTHDDAPSAADITGLQEKFKSDKDAAQVSFSSVSELTTGLRSTAKVRHFEIKADEPEMLGGTDTAPNPVEILLAALGSCQEITYKAYGQAMGIPIDRVSVAVDGHLDLRGFFGVADYSEARPGLHTIEGTVTIESSASAEDLAALKGAVDTHCPVLDILTQKVPVELGLNVAGPGTTLDNDDAPPASAIAGLQTQFKADKDAAQVSFSSVSELTTGLRSTAKVRHFEIKADEPEMLGGTDTAPNPVEILLAALGSCQEITYKAYGQAMGIPIDRVSVAVDGHLDLRGFFGVADYSEARPGLHTIEGTVTIESSASAEDLAALKGAVDTHCPVLDILTQKVPVELNLK